MSNSPEPLPIKQSDDGKWEVENFPGHWIKCENEADAKILSNAPIVLQESFEVFHPNEKVASKLDRTAEKMEQYNMSFGGRYFRAMAKKARGKAS
jgi:hypothetical protein